MRKRFVPAGESRDEGTGDLSRREIDQLIGKAHARKRKRLGFFNYTEDVALRMSGLSRAILVFCRPTVYADESLRTV